MPEMRPFCTTRATGGLKRRLVFVFGLPDEMFPALSPFLLLAPVCILHLFHYTKKKRAKKDKDEGRKKVASVEKG